MQELKKCNDETNRNTLLTSLLRSLQHFKSMVNYQHSRIGSPIHLFATDISKLEELFKIGNVNVNSQNGDGMTALHIAAKKGYPKCVEFLTSHGAEIIGFDNSWRIPLHYAVESGVISVVEHLVNACNERYVNLNVTSCQYTFHITSLSIHHELLIKC